MVTNETSADMLDLLTNPAFYVKDGMVIRTNQAARGIPIADGTPVVQLISIGVEEYEAFTGGCLYLQLQLGSEVGAYVTKLDGMDVFVVEKDEEFAELQAMALAAQEIRQPLASLMAMTDQLFPLLRGSDVPEADEQVARINKSLYQMLRIVSNMSDAYGYCTCSNSRQEPRDIPQLLQEIFEAVIPLAQAAGIQMEFSNTAGSIYSLADPERLERAISNILSNAIKFTPAGGVIQAQLVRRGHRLYLTVSDNGNGIPEDLRASVYRRYQRQPGLEDGRFGIGLGMVMIRSVASQHGGTVLLEQDDSGVRLTMTLAIRQDTEGRVRTPVMRVDYAGERDHRLIELSESLPAHLYGPNKVN